MFKTLAFAIIIAGGMWLAVMLNPTEETYERPITEEVPVVVEEIDIVDKARQDLERINNELDFEETRLLEERAQIDARLEEIRETRVSFQ